MVRLWPDSVPVGPMVGPLRGRLQMGIAQRREQGRSAGNVPRCEVKSSAKGGSVSYRYSLYRTEENGPPRRFIGPANEREEAIKTIRDATVYDPARFELYDNSKLRWEYAAQRQSGGELVEEF